MLIIRVLSYTLMPLIAMSWLDRLLGPSNLFFRWGWDWWVNLTNELVTLGVEG